MSLCLFNLYAEYIIQNDRPDESQAGIKIARRNINLRYADDTTLMTENEEELKSPLMKVKEESEKADLKLNIQKTKIRHMVLSLHGKQREKKWKQWMISFSWAAKLVQTVTAAMKLKCLLLGRKAMTNLDRVLKTKRHQVANKVDKAIVFPVVM